MIDWNCTFKGERSGAWAIMGRNWFEMLGTQYSVTRLGGFGFQFCFKISPNSWQLSGLSWQKCAPTYKYFLELNGSAYSWLPSISNMVVGHFEDPWNLTLTNNMNRQRVLWIHGKWGFIFVCGQQPKDLVITWVVLVLDTLLIYFWGALRGTLLGWISGLNLSAYLGPVLVVFGSDLPNRQIE